MFLYTVAFRVEKELSQERREREGFIQKSSGQCWNVAWFDIIYLTFRPSFWQQTVGSRLKCKSGRLTEVTMEKTR